MRRRLVAWVALTAASCGGRPAPRSQVREGIALSLYDGGEGEPIGVVDERRWIDVAGDTVVLDRVDLAAALQTLVIEPLAGGALRVGACRRERVGTLAVGLRCAVDADPGRHLVRVMYATSALVARAEHGVELTAADRATISSRFAIAAPAWGTTAEVTVFRGAPGRDPPPRELVRGTIALDGSTAVLAVPPRDVAAQLRWIYAGAVHPADEPAPRDPSWGHGSQAAVWVWLELADHAIGPGPLHVHLEPAGEPARDIDVPARARREAAPGLRLPLWIDDGLHGKRERRTAQRGETGRALVDQFQIAIASTRADGAPREVWIEEQLRPAPHRTVSHGWPIEPIVTPRTLRLPLEVAPGQLARAGFDVAYDW